MRQFTFLVSAAAILGLFAVTRAAPIAAQDSSPAASGLSGMSVESTGAVLEPYLAALTAREDIAPFFADDVVLSLVEVGQEMQGRDAVAGAIAALHRQTFDASLEVVMLVVGEGTGAGEFVFVGTHTGEFTGIAATGRQIRVPHTVFYDLADNQITALRIYGFASGLEAQLTAEATSAPQPLIGYTEP